VNTRLMHCLPRRAGLALSLPLAVALSAFFANAALAQDVQLGLAIYQSKCVACHSVDEHRVGPAHAGVLGRRAGSAKGYDYSDALAKSKIIWSKATLDAWLTDPEQIIAGQRMGYRLSLAQERADVIAYLATLRPPAPPSSPTKPKK
jgi:cytochrome c